MLSSSLNQLFLTASSSLFAENSHSEQPEQSGERRPRQPEIDPEGDPKKRAASGSGGDCLIAAYPGREVTARPEVVPHEIRRLEPKCPALRITLPPLMNPITCAAECFGGIEIGM
jgi:hypothetical protein